MALCSITINSETNVNITEATICQSFVDGFEATEILDQYKISDVIKAQ